VPFSSLALQFGNYPAALTSDLLNEAQSVYFFTLVVMQWGCVIFFFHFALARNSKLLITCYVMHSNLLSTRTRRSSIFQQPPTWGINRAVIPAAICALVIGIFFCYVPVLYVVVVLALPPFRLAELMLPDN
jgi:sodium/potassium-transporting ATPase subunit alpha